MIHNIEKYIVIMGSQKEVGHFTIHGTGFLISIKDKAYAVTCRHVAMNMCKHDVKFIIPNPKRTLTIPTALLLSEPIYYNLKEPYIDICLMNLPEYSSSVLGANGINTIDLDSLKETTNASTGDKLISYGYPGCIISKYLSENNPIMLVPVTVIHSTATNWIMGKESFSPQNTEGIISYDSKSIQLTYTESDLSNIEGISGGPVLQKETGLLCGIATSGRIDQQLPNNEIGSIFNITPISFLIDMIRLL